MVGACSISIPRPHKSHASTCHNPILQGLFNPEFHFVLIPDGLSKTNFSPSNFMAALLALNSNREAPFQQYMEEMMKVEDPHDRVAGVVYDGFMHFAQAVANNLKLPGINVRTSAAATLLLFAVFPDAHHCIS